MKNSELYSLQAGLNEVSGLKGLKFAIMVAKNLKAISAETQTFNETQQSTQPVASEEFIAYDKARSELAEEHADKDDKGKAIIVDNKFVMSERQKEFDEAWKLLREEHAEAVEARDADIQAFQKEFAELMDAESDVVLVTVAEDSLPADITGDQLVQIMSVVVE